MKEKTWTIHWKLKFYLRKTNNTCNTQFENIWPLLFVLTREKKNEENQFHILFIVLVLILFLHCCVVCSVRYAYVLNNEYYYRYLWILNKFSKKKNENTMFYIHMIWYIFLFEEIGTPESADTESKHLKKKVTESRKKMNQKCFLNLKNKLKVKFRRQKKTQCQNRHKTNEKEKLHWSLIKLIDVFVCVSEINTRINRNILNIF